MSDAPESFTRKELEAALGRKVDSRVVLVWVGDRLYERAADGVYWRLGS